MQEQQALLSLSYQAQQDISTDVVQRAQIESCGVLLGVMMDGEWLVEEALPLRNTASSPVYFEFDPAELLEIEIQYPGRIIGVYHSHPTGYARASQTDQQNMQHVNQVELIPWCWLIVCGPFQASFAELVQANHGVLPEERLIAHYYDAEQGLMTLAINRCSRTT